MKVCPKEKKRLHIVNEIAKYLKTKQGYDNNILLHQARQLIITLYLCFLTYSIKEKISIWFGYIRVFYMLLDFCCLNLGYNLTIRALYFF